MCAMMCADVYVLTDIILKEFWQRFYLQKLQEWVQHLVLGW